MKKKLLVVGQDVKLNYIFEEAQRLDIQIYYIHEEKESVLPAKALVKEVFQLPVFKDPEGSIKELERLHETYRFDGILTLYDPALSFVAKVCERFGFSALESKFTENCRQKDNIRRILEENDLNAPRYYVYKNASDINPEDFEGEYPLIIKPSNAFFSHGVCRVNNKEELIVGIGKVDEINRDSISNLVYEKPSIIIEQFIDGPEFAIESFSINGEVNILSVGYKGDCKGPFFEETVYIAPANIPEQVLFDIKDQVTRALIALGVKSGPGHTEVRINQKWKPFIIETAPRIGGSGVSHFIVQQSTGINFMELVLKHALGEVDKTILEKGFEHNKVAGNYIIPVKGSGVFKEFKNVNKVKDNLQVKEFVEFYEEGVEVLPYPSFSGYPGFVLTVHDSYEECESFYRMLDEEVFVEYY